MKDNNRFSKDNNKKNNLLSKKEIKIVNHVLDNKKSTKTILSNNNKKSNIIKKSSPNKLEPIKVKLTPINRINARLSSKGKKNIIIKDSSFNPYQNSKIYNSLYLSPSNGVSFENENITKNKNENKFHYTENRKDIKEVKNNKIDRNCNTPYRKILNIRPKEPYSPSTSVIIKNFNYNNVYNINIENDKNRNKNNNKFNNKSVIKKNIYDNNLTTFNTNDSEISNKYINKDSFSKKFTYNKPKTSSGMNAPCILSKRNKSKDISLLTESNNKEKNIKIKNKNGSVYSRFISEGNSLKNCRNNLNFSNLITDMSKLDNINLKNNIHTPNRCKTNNNFNLSTQKTNIKDYNNTINGIVPNKNSTYSNHFSTNNSFSNINFKKKVANHFYSTSSISLNNTFVNKNITSTPKISSKKENKEEDILDKKNDNNNENYNDENKKIIFNLNDLFIFEDRINDIVSAFNKTNNIYDIEASNECNEFISFYSKSSIKGIFSTFFKDNNKLIIESSINLSLFFISIIYNLSINNFLFNDLISTINIILSYLKINFSLYIKNIQLYYGLDIVKKNIIYFQPFNNFLKNNNINDIEDEDDITFKIYQNCRSITNEIKIIMQYYQKVDLSYYNFFIKIFNNISIQKESDLIKYFYAKLGSTNSSFNLITVNKNNNINNNSNNNSNIIIKDSIQNYKLKKNKSNLTLTTSFSPFKKKSLENLSIKINDKIYQKTPIRSLKKEKVNKIEIPYIREPCEKKYTLILDLNKTLAFYNKEKIYLRNGLFSLLSMIKPYYELISFSCDPNDITENIIKEIESQKTYFDYKFTREHSILYENTLVKDISLIGRDVSKVIIIDDDENCFKLNKENGIKIKGFSGNNKNDNVLFELKKILILIYKNNYDDIRVALKDFSNDIKSKISL